MHNDYTKYKRNASICARADRTSEPSMLTNNEQTRRANTLHSQAQTRQFERV